MRCLFADFTSKPHDRSTRTAENARKLLQQNHKQLDIISKSVVSCYTSCKSRLLRGWGLPSAPKNLSPKDGDDPWADYTVAQMYDFLSHYKLPRKPGAKFDYSNFGMGLLGCR
jgi:hypothetical protein